MRGGAQPARGGRTPVLNREELIAERVRVTALPPSDDRTKALRKIKNQLQGLAYRSERNGI